MNIGRRHNADPRWLLPLLCRRGHLTRNEVGAIRIQANETHFAIPRGSAGRFMAAVKRTAQEGDGDEAGVLFEMMGDARPAPQGARQHGGPNRPQQPAPERAGPPKVYAPKPWMAKGGKPKGPKPKRAG
jgi:ATP-dependent RNA helicase DeaD